MHYSYGKTHKFRAFFIRITFQEFLWESGNTAEVDFVIHLNGKAIPVEVKSADNTKSKSLMVFMKKYQSEYAYKISAKNFGFENNIKSIPLYALFCLKDI